MWVMNSRSMAFCWQNFPKNDPQRHRVEKSSENISEPKSHLEMSCCRQCWSWGSPQSSLASDGGSCHCCCRPCWMKNRYFNCFARKYFTISHLLVCFSEFSRLSWRSLWISWRWDWMMFSLSCRTWPRRTCSLFRFPVKKYFLKHFPSLQQNIFCYENFNKNIFFSFLVLIINKTFACINLAKIANTKYSNPIIPPRPSELWRYQWR